MKLKLPNTENIRNSPFVKFLKNFVGNTGVISFCAKTIVSLVILAFTFIPFWFYLFIRWLLEPGDFWQDFAVFAVSAIVLGLPQLIMVVFGVIMILTIVLEDY